MVFTKIGNFFSAFSATNNGGDRQKKNISQGIAGFPGLTIVMNDRDLVQKAESVHSELSGKRKDKITGG